MPVLDIDVEAIGRNTETVAALLRAHALGLVAVTKGCLGEPAVAAAMLAGGALALADTRDANLRRLRAALPAAELHRIHLPSFTEPFEPGDVSYISSLEGAEAVAAVSDPSGGRPGSADLRGGAATAAPLRVMIQVETGDEREGVPGDQVPALAARLAALPGLQLAGVSTNYACFKGTPDGILDSVEKLARVAAELRREGHAVERVSGGNSSLLGLLLSGRSLPPEVTELRCGEALLLGREALHYNSLPGCRTDACLLRAEVVEEYTKPAGGRLARRLVLGIGRQDLSTGTVTFLEPGLSEVGRSADYLVVEHNAGAGTEAAGDGGEAAECGTVALGRMICMIPSYQALVAAWTSPYVELRLHRV
jgi:ornithine racemase